MQTAANSQKRGKNTKRSPTHLGKCRRKKEKRRSFSLENSDVYLAPFGEGCESKKYKIAVMRAREGRTDEKRKLYTVIATNNEPYARQLHYAKQSADLSTTAPRARVGRLTVGCYMKVQVLFLVPLPKNSNINILTSSPIKIECNIIFHVTFSAIFLSLPSYPPIYY